MQAASAGQRPPASLAPTIAVLLRPRRNVGDRAFQTVLAAMGATIVLFGIMLLFSMFQAGLPALVTFGPAFVWTTVWNPVTHVFGILPAIFGTVATSALALFIAVPMGVGAAIFLAELAPRWLADPVSFLDRKSVV